MRAAAQYLRIFGFLAIIVLPLIGMKYAKGSVLTTENRARTPRPKLTFANWRRYPEAFDAYFRDSFGYRDKLIHWHHVLTVKELRESPVPQVIIGGGGRLFYAGYGDGVDITDFSGHYPFTAAQLDAYLAQSLARRQQYAAAGAHYLVVLVPNKQTIYPEDVPDRFGPHVPGLYDAVARKLGGRSDLDVLDLRPILRAHKDEPDYYATDSHWNANGGFLAASAIVDRARAWFPTLEPLRRSDYEVSHHKGPGRDLAAMLAMVDDFPDDLWTYTRRGGDTKQLLSSVIDDQYERPTHPGPHVLLLGDSFGGAVAPLLGDVFGRVRRYYSARTGNDPKIFAAEKPDLVVLLLVERYFPRLADQ